MADADAGLECELGVDDAIVLDQESGSRLHGDDGVAAVDQGIAVQFSDSCFGSGQ